MKKIILSIIVSMLLVGTGVIAWDKFPAWVYDTEGNHTDVQTTNGTISVLLEGAKFGNVTQDFILNETRQFNTTEGLRTFQAGTALDCPPPPPGQPDPCDNPY